MGSGKLKEKEDGNKESRGITKRGKLSKLDTIRISTVDQLKFTSDKGSESMTTFLNLKDGDRIKESNIHEDDPKQYKSLIRQKSRQKEETIIEEKRSTHLKSSPSLTQVPGNSRQALEKKFLDRFNDIASLDKEKNIKFFQCIGDPTFTKENENEIIQERDTNRVQNNRIFEF